MTNHTPSPNQTNKPTPDPNLQSALQTPNPHALRPPPTPPSPFPNPQSLFPNPQSLFPNLLPSSLVLLIYVLLTLILTYPLLFNLSTTVPNDIGDPLLNTWILAWDSHTLLTDPFNLFNANIFYPLPNTLAYSEHLFSTALLALPVQLITGEPIVAYNLSLLGSFPLAAFGMYLLILRWTRRRSAAFIAGLLFGFTPYRFAAIAHLQLLIFFWLPFALLFLDLLLNAGQKNRLQPKVDRAGLPTSALEKKTRRGLPVPLSLSLALTLFLTLQILASWYLAVYTLLIIGLYLLAGLLTGSFYLSRFSLLVGTVLLVLLLTLPFVLPYLALINELQQARPLSLALSLAAAPADFAAAAPFNRIFGPLTQPFRSRPGFTEENMLFLGLIGPVLALVPLLVMIKDCVLHTAYFVFAGTKVNSSSKMAQRPSFFAPHFVIYALGAVLVLSLALTFSGPYRFLAHLVPPSTIVRVPPRWVIPALFAFSALAGIGYALISERLTKNEKQTNIRRTPRRFAFTPKSAVLLTFCTLFLLAEATSIPLPLAPVENQNELKPAYRWLAGQAEPFALVELPLYSDDLPEFPEVKRIYASTLAWWPLINGYSGYTPPRQHQLAATLNRFPNEPSLTTLQTLATLPTPSHLSGTHTAKSLLSPPPSPNPLPQSPEPHSPLSTPYSPLPTPHSLPLLLLLHPGESPLDRNYWETVARWQAERNPALYPLGRFDGDYLYRVLPPHPDRFSGSSLATFGPDRSIHLLAINKANAPPLNHSSRITHHSQLFLYWQPTTPLQTDYTVFIHLRAADGFIQGQADGLPVSGHYPTTTWQSGEVIQDIHSLPPVDFNQIDHLAVGLYNPDTGERLPAYGPNGQRLTNDALIVSLPR